MLLKDTKVQASDLVAHSVPISSNPSELPNILLRYASVVADDIVVAFKYTVGNAESEFLHLSRQIIIMIAFQHSNRNPLPLASSAHAYSDSADLQSCPPCHPG